MILDKNILIITGTSSFSIISKIIKPIKNYKIDVFKAPITISAFLTKDIVIDILKKISVSNYDLILLPGFVQWDTNKIEEKFKVEIKKGPEFASDLPFVLKNLENITLSGKLPANKLIEISGEKEYTNILEEQKRLAQREISSNSFYINKRKTNVMISPYLPPPIIAEIVNCTERSENKILKKVKHYVESGADIIDIGCVSNNAYPERIPTIIKTIRRNFDVLLSIDSMDKSEIMAAINADIDMILSFDLGNYKDFLDIPKTIPIVILPTDMKKAYFPKNPKERVENLFKLTQILQDNGFQKLIADPLLETPISPGICNSLDSYMLYNKMVGEKSNKSLKLPLFFGISNVVELMDIDSVGINGLLASFAIELGIGVLFTVEHSVKLMGGISELKESVKLNYLAHYRKSPPINQGITIFKSKGKTRQKIPKIDLTNALNVKSKNTNYNPDVNGYFRIYVEPYAKKIYLLFYSNENVLLKTLIGTNAEALCKKFIQLGLTKNNEHLNYLGRELERAQICLELNKPYIQDE
ncbi:MAG: dihydropteroate synthase-like protein [Promethearchaeota archaeon]|nr:MAG: dihydropteroate synthase-like protein [Candidatus Lokiarchaeota archaeon]